MASFAGSNGTANITFQQTASSGLISWVCGPVGSPFILNPSTSPTNIIFGTIPQNPPEVRRTTKSVNITASLKGFNVTFYDAHGGAKSSEFSKDELTAALPDLLAKLTKEPKED